MRNWLKTAVSLCETAKTGSFAEIKQALLQIDELNLFLKTKKAQPTAAQNAAHPLKNQWTALRAALQHAAKRLKIEKSFLMVGEEGFEPSCQSARILSPLCIPVPPLALKYLVYFT